MLSIRSDYLNRNSTALNNHEEESKNKTEFKMYPRVKNSRSNTTSDFPYLPYKIVNEMVTHYLVPFVQKAAYKLGNVSISLKDAETSCVLNLLALMVIF